MKIWKGTKILFRKKKNVKNKLSNASNMGNFFFFHREKLHRYSGVCPPLHEDLYSCKCNIQWVYMCIYLYIWPFSNEKSVANRARNVHDVREILVIPIDIMQYIQMYIGVSVHVYVYKLKQDLFMAMNSIKHCI